MDKNRRTVILSWIALSVYLISLFFPYQIIISRWGDDEVYPPEPQYAIDIILPLLLFLLNIPLLLRLIQQDVKKSSSWTFLLAIGLLSVTMVLLLLLSSFISGWYLTKTEIGTGAYLSLISAFLFFYAALSKPIPEIKNKIIKNDLLDEEINK